MKELKPIKVISPAKINLMLRILGQRKDGYHLLQTYFQLLNWGDEMEFILTTPDAIEVTGDFNDLPQQENLIYKAAQILLPFKKTNVGIEIKVEKNIPQGSGLGGGSSNAGTTLRVLNQVWKCDLTQEQLQKLALELGADVPIFILNQSAMATGIGEDFEIITIKPYYYVLIFPNVSITTADIFGETNLKRDQQIIQALTICDKRNWTNACFPTVLNKYPEVKNIYNIASKYSIIYMSGTGSTLFACFENNDQAQDFVQQCPNELNTIICKSK